MAIPPFDPASEPLGSTSPLVREVNSKLLDLGMHSKEDTFTDRFGEEKMTWEAMQNERIGLLIAGGQIFPTEAEGRAAAEDGWYFYAVSPSPNVTRSLYRRISSSESQWVADDPSAEFVNRVASELNSTTPIKLSYPNVDFALNYPAEMIVDHDFNLITASSGDGSLTTVIRSTGSAVQYPNTTYKDDQISATVNREGGIIDSKTLRQAFGKYAEYPYQSYSETGEIKQVDANNDIVVAPSRWGDRMLVTLDGETNDLFVVWPHGKNKMLRVNYRPNGKNELFNWRSTEIAEFGDPASASWETIASYGSDCWPPLILSAINNGDGGAPIYTGGNHGSDGGAGGVTTAYMSGIEFSVDGRKLLRGEYFSGYADRVGVRWQNEVMAYNTITAGRYVARQAFSVKINAGDVSGYCAVTALEPITLEQDNGPQFFATGYEKFHFYDGQQQDSLPIPSGIVNSGAFSAYPAWALVLAHPENGFHGGWMDRQFEAGDGRYIYNDASAYRKGGDKFYSRVISADNGGLALQTGESYEWHGGYFWSPADTVSGDVDSAFTFHRRNRPQLGYAFTGAGAGAIDLPLWASGSEVSSVGVDGINGIAVSAAAYETSYNLIED